MCVMSYYIFFPLLTTFLSQIFASHGIGGIAGNILTGIFAQASVAGFDGSTVIPGGWLDRHFKQLGVQLADSCAGFSYSFVMTVSPSLYTCTVACTYVPFSNPTDPHPLGHALHPRPQLARL